METNEERHFKSVPRNEKNVKDIQVRLSRVMGQIGGIKKMIDEGRYCTEILIQISACERALGAVSDILLKEHLETCVVEQVQKGNLDIVDETMELLKKMR